jgi:FkbM family methyltransferase
MKVGPSRVNWSAIDPHSLLGGIVRLPARLLPAEKILHIRGGPARGMKWIAGSSINGCWLGSYELEKQKALLRFVKPGMTVYDVGAQAGFYTLFSSRIVGKTGRVFAFEPYPHCARFLVDHVRMNGLSNVRVLQIAVGERNGFIGMTVDHGLMENKVHDSSGSILMVAVVTIDDCGLSTPDIIKLDVEGAEHKVLQGAQMVLRETRPILFIALHGSAQRELCSTFLSKAGYAIYELGGARLHEPVAVDEIYALPEESISRWKHL